MSNLTRHLNCQHHFHSSAIWTIHSSNCPQLWSIYLSTNYDWSDQNQWCFKGIAAEVSDHHSTRKCLGFSVKLAIIWGWLGNKSSRNSLFILFGLIPSL